MARRTTTHAQRPTLEDVASAAGVSRALVSIVVRGTPGASDETRARVLAVAEELGYRPDVRARLLARASSRLLGVTYAVGSLHHADLVAPIYEAAETAGYEVVLSAKTPRHDERRAVNTLLGYRCDAIVMLASGLPEAELRALSASVPVVLVGRRLSRRHETMDTVRTDDDAGMRLAVEHLVGLGHRRIAHVDGGIRPYSTDRRRGYREQMKRFGLGDEVQVETGDEALREVVRRAGTRLMEQERRPTAVIAFNDEAAWGVMRAASEHGLAVPADVSVVGYDATPLSRVAPHELTTVGQDADAMGRLAVELAVARLAGDTEPRNVVLSPCLVPGDTTGPPPAQQD